MAMTIRLDDADEAALLTIMSKEGVSKAGAIKRAIHEMAQRTERHDDLRAFTRTFSDEYRDVLDRLAE